MAHEVMWCPEAAVSGAALTSTSMKYHTRVCRSTPLISIVSLTAVPLVRWSAIVRHSFPCQTTVALHGQAPRSSPRT
jgi:hypothetical protein